MFVVRGTFKMGSNWQKFTKEVEAGTEEQAIEKVYSLLGSNHHTKRVHIKIESVERVEEEENAE